MSEVIYDPIADALNISPVDFDIQPIVFEAFDSEIERQQAIKRNKELRTCPHCKRDGHGPNMDRWHFDNCALKETKYCKGCGGAIPKIFKASRYYKTEYCNQNCYHEHQVGIGRPHTEEAKKRMSEIALSQSEMRSKRMKELHLSGRIKNKKSKRSL